MCSSVCTYLILRKICERSLSLRARVQINVMMMTVFIRETKRKTPYNSYERYIVFKCNSDNQIFGVNMITLTDIFYTIAACVVCSADNTCNAQYLDNLYLCVFYVL